MSRRGTSNEDDDMDAAAVREWFEGYKQKLRDEGFKEGERNLLLRQLRVRFGELPAAAVAPIEAAGVAELGRWGERVLGARTLDEVLNAPR